MLLLKLIYYEYLMLYGYFPVQIYNFSLNNRNKTTFYSITGSYCDKIVSRRKVWLANFRKAARCYFTNILWNVPLLSPTMFSPLCLFLRSRPSNE